MADNTTLNAGSGGDTIATDDVSSVKHQLVKVEWGTDGVATMVSASNPLPVTATGNAAAGAATSGNPVLMAAEARTTNPTAVDNGDVVKPQADDEGRLVVRTAPRDLLVKQATTIAASTTETTIVTAGAAGIFHDLLALILANTSGTAARVDFRDATAGSVIFSVYLPAGDTRVISFGDSPWPQATAANNWTAQSSASVTDLRITVLACKNV